MDDGLRKRYLEAMGIQGWVRRLPEIPDREDEGHPERRGVRFSRPQPSAADEPAGAAQTGAPIDGSSAQAASSPTAGDEEAAGVATGSRGDVSELGWDALRRRVVSCTACALAETRTQAVFGVGDPNAKLLIIGEAPGADEDRQGEPFVGRAGQLLNAMLRAIGLAREQVFIANILKCRPPGNRDPRSEEALLCAPFLLRQIALIRPRVILSVGRISAQNLLNTETAVGRLRGRVHEFGSNRIPLVVTYHPAYLLRSPEQKAKAWQDLLLVMATLREKVS